MNELMKTLWGIAIFILLIKVYGFLYTLIWLLVFSIAPPLGAIMAFIPLFNFLLNL